MDEDRKIEIGLLLLRLSVFLVMLVWTLDKFLNPEHAAGVYERFYMIGGLGTGVFYLIGAVQLAIVLGFVAGFAKTATYGLVLVMHGVSTLSSWQQYLSPYDGANILFFAAWPMLAACLTLFLLRERDRLLALR